MAEVSLGGFHEYTNMAATRLCVLLTVLVGVKMLAAQPIFGTRMWCDMFCDDDDDDEDYDSSSIESFLDALWDPCSGCGTSKPSKKPPKHTTVAPGMQQPFNLMIPPANGMNLTMTNTGTSWLMNFIPWAAMPAMAPTAAATTAAPATTAKPTTAANGTATTAKP